MNEVKNNFDSDIDRDFEIYQILKQNAEARVGSDEGGVFEVLDFDPNSEYHLLKNKFFAVPEENNRLGKQALGALAELALAGYDDSKFSQDLSTVKRLTSGLTDKAKEVKERVDFGRSVFLITAHQTRFEPIIVPFLVTDSMSESAEEFDKYRNINHLIVARYLGCYGLRLGSSEDTPPNALAVARQVANIHTTFPDTVNSREKSGIPVDFQKSYNFGFYKNFKNIESGSIITMAGSGTMGDEAKTGEISRASTGTCILPTRGDFDVVAVASILDGNNQFSVMGEITDSSEVDKNTVHEKMEWIAEERTKKGYQSSYAQS